MTDQVELPDVPEALSEPEVDVPEVEEVEEVQEVEEESIYDMDDDAFDKLDIMSIESPEEVSQDDSEEDDANVSDEEEDAPGTDVVAFDKTGAYDTLMSEFKANGKMMSPGSVEDARRLMQMGANYNKKMAKIKDDQRYVQMLKANGLLNEDKLNHLIDLSKNDKGAVEQLLKSAEIDPMDLDVSEDSVYTPNTYTVDERQVHLNDLLDSIEDTAGYSTTMDLVGNKWDEASRTALINKPDDILRLNEHVGSGIYDRILPIVEHERMLGRLDGVSDVDAYFRVGDAMNARGDFDDTAVTTQAQQAPIKAPALARPDNKKKLAAAAPRKSNGSTKPTLSQADIFGMNDDEFEKQFNL